MKLWAWPRQEEIILGFGSTFCGIIGEGTEKYVCTWLKLLWADPGLQNSGIQGYQFSKAFSSQASNISLEPKYLGGRAQSGVKLPLRLGFPQSRPKTRALMQAAYLDAIPGSQYKVLMRTHYCWGQLGPNPSRDLRDTVQPHLHHPIWGVRAGTLFYQVSFAPGSIKSPALPACFLLTSPSLLLQLKKPSDRVTDSCSRKSLACKKYAQENNVWWKL